MSLFQVWCPDYGSGPDDARTFNAVDLADAVQQWALCQDTEGADYLIVGGQDATVVVSDGETERTFIVSGESVPYYRARLVV